ncbi:hypothetical protein FIU87_19430 [Bacillus sp. THAF10]|nr:hypothetical protein FIU87_19430 [Bacillus sp. THAF10]
MHFTPYTTTQKTDLNKRLIEKYYRNKMNKSERGVKLGHGTRPSVPKDYRIIATNEL